MSDIDIQHNQNLALRVFRKISAIAQAGLFYSKNNFDLERYQELQAVAAEILAANYQIQLEDSLAALRNNTGYCTPKIDVRAACFREGKILLVREQDDGLWCLPGGWGEVGLSPSQAIIKEVFEETGLAVVPTDLIAVFSEGEAFESSNVFHEYRLIFNCSITNHVDFQANSETDACEFFSQDAIPPLSPVRTSMRQIQHCFAKYDHPETDTFFD